MSTLRQIYFGAAAVPPPSPAACRIGLKNQLATEHPRETAQGRHHESHLAPPTKVDGPLSYGLAELEDTLTSRVCSVGSDG
jgi:hypothetical protein